MTSFSICTYNVHSLHDQHGQDAFDRVVQLLQETEPDILALQECYRFDVKKLLTVLPYKTSLKWGGCALLSNLDMAEVELGGRKPRKGYHPRFLTGEVNIEGKKLYVTCCHLNHKNELKRMAELRTMELQLAQVFRQGDQQLWVGDFNSL